MDRDAKHPKPSGDILAPMDPLAAEEEDEGRDDYAELWPPTRISCTTFDYFLALLLFGVFALNFINVIGRRATDFTPAWFEGVARFFASLGWIDEASRFIVIWVGFIGAAVVYAANKHVSLTILIDRVPAKVAHGMRIAHTLVVGAVFGVYLWFGFIVARMSINRSTALDLPMWFVYLCVPLAALFGLYFTLEKLTALLRPASAASTPSAPPRP